jgi:hypothetical protein
MNGTGHGDEGGKLHKEGCPQKVAVKPRGYAGTPDRGKMAEKQRRQHRRSDYLKVRAN